ncbi:MAG: hypothetical protein ACYC5Q_12985, partial [Thermoleophilia bacterium]
MTQQAQGSTSPAAGGSGLSGAAGDAPPPAPAGLGGALRAGLGSRVLVPAVAVMFGMQTLRVLLPLLVYVLRDRVGLQAMHLGGIALVLFALSFLVGPLLRTAGARRPAFVTLVGLAIVRVAMQLWQGDPLVDLALAMAGTLLFLLYLPAAAVSSVVAATTMPVAAVARPGATATTATPESSDAPPTVTTSSSVAPAESVSAAPFALGFLLGLGLDTALNGILGTYDLAWRTGAASAASVVVLAVALVALAMPPARRDTGVLDAAAFTAPRAWPWLALGPLLALEMLVFQNVARLATLTGVPLPAAAALAAAGHAVGLVVAALSLRGGSGAPAAPEARGGATRAAARVAPVMSAAAALLLVLSVLPAAPKGVAAGLLFLAGQTAVALLAVPVLTAVGTRGGATGGGTAGYGRLALAHGGGMVLLVLFLFLAYSGYDIALPFSADVLPPVAALIVGACALRVAVGAGRRSASSPSGAFVVGGIAPPQGGAAWTRAAARRRARAARLG